MKKLIKYIIIPALAGLIVSCNEIDVPITTQMTPDVFPQNDAQYAQTAGAVYSVFRGEYAKDPALRSEFLNVCGLNK